MKLLLLVFFFCFLAWSTQGLTIDHNWEATSLAKLKKNGGLKQRIKDKFHQLTGKVAPTGDQQLLTAIQTNYALKQMLDGAKN